MTNHLKLQIQRYLDKFVIVDFGDIFFPLDEISSFPDKKERHEDYLENAKDIVENGF